MARESKSREVVIAVLVICTCAVVGFWFAWHSSEDRARHRSLTPTETFEQAVSDSARGAPPWRDAAPVTGPRLHCWSAWKTTRPDSRSQGRVCAW